MTVLMGTSGWQYRDWRPGFYPARLPQRLWLERHVEAFATVEVNNAFYRLPKRETFEAWRDRTPDDYVITVKASRYLSHFTRLREPEEPVGRLMERVAGLGAKLGPVLVQLPPDLQLELERLERTLAAFPAGTRVVVEPRHDSWWVPEVEDLLRRFGAALCWADRDGVPLTPLWRTADFAYLRLHHGPVDWEYGDEALLPWAERLIARTDEHEDVFVYTNNDPGQAAIRDAAALARLLRERGRSVTRVPEPTWHTPEPGASA